VRAERRSVLEHVKFYFDPACPWCYQTSRWARRVEEMGEIELDWGIFSLEVVNLPPGKDARELDARSGPALRTALAMGPSPARSTGTAGALTAASSRVGIPFSGARRPATSRQSWCCLSKTSVPIPTTSTSATA